MRKHVAGTLALIVLALGLIAAAQDSGRGPAPPQKAARQQRAKATGERLFAEHCGRCHAAPADIPPKAAGTILRHMRVRANLTAEDERLILRYIAP